MDSLDFTESSYNIPLNYEREYIYNTKSGSLLRLDSGETLAKLCEDEKTFDYLLDNGFVTNVDERAGLRFKHCTAQNDQTYLHFTIFITLDCNFNCYYCYEHKTQKTLSNSNIDKLLSYIEKEYGKGKIKRLHITWMGGEPLLEHKKIVSISSRIITLSKNYSVRYTASLVTNGFFLATCESNFISSTQINEIQLTFDGPENYHNIVKNTHNPNDPSFSGIMNSIEQIMNNNNINLALRVNVSMENKDLIFNLIDEILELIKKYRLILNFAPIDDDTDKNPNLMLMDDKTFAEYNFQYHEYLLKKDALFKALPRPRDIPCQAYHINSFVVAPGGELLTCNHDINDIANMKISTLDTPQNIDYHNLEIYHFQDIFGDSECSECQYLPLCMGYCTFLKRNNKPIKCLPKLMPLALLAYNMEEKLKEDL